MGLHESWVTWALAEKILRVGHEQAMTVFLIDDLRGKRAELKGAILGAVSVHAGENGIWRCCRGRLASYHFRTFGSE